MKVREDCLADQRLRDRRGIKCKAKIDAKSPCVCCLDAERYSL